MNTQENTHQKSPLFPDGGCTLKKVLSCEELIDLWKSQFDIDITDEIHGIDEIELYEEHATQLQFFQPDDAAGSGLLYEQLQKFDWYYMANKWEHIIALNDLKNCSNVLEVGSAKGDFVKTALSRGIAIKGIDINQAAVRTAQDAGLPVAGKDLQTLIQEGESFDGICCFQILEHVVSPKQFLDLLLKLLSPGGQLILSVPNADSFLKYQYNLLDMPPHHMTRWNAETFRSLEKIFPLSLKQTRFEPLASYHVDGYLRSYAKHFAKTSKVKKRFLNLSTIDRVAYIVNTFGIRRFLKGQTLYALLEKIR